MPRYDYYCEANDRVVEVRHGADEKLHTWAEVAARAGLAPDATPGEAPVERVIHPPALGFPRGDSELKSQGFTKLVRRSDGSYENVTATGNEAKVIRKDDSAAIASLNLKHKLGD
ncbi:MAG: zinc ribbon domain-containing protein [Vicinamibacteria bacterium]|jgi:hypothetical protein|nr:zinc ribbon domain-containing protein [Vicinamibacteria bacterium]